MSRIHDALKKAEEEKASEARLPGAARAIETAVTLSAAPQASPSVLTAVQPPPAMPAREGVSRGSEIDKLLLEGSIQRSWNPDRKTMLHFDRRNPVVGLEEFRTLRSHLYLLRGQRTLQKLLITSPLPKEGKTFVAANLAQIFARQNERRALLIDADLRSSSLHRVLGAPATPGLSDYLLGEAGEFSVVQRGSLDNLFFIAGGKSVPNPSELIGNGRLKLLLHRLAPAFDWIILDTPPVMLVSDAKLLADFCDGALIVVRAGATPFDLAQKACQEFREKHVVGAVLNRVESGLTYSSYYYYPGNVSTGNNKAKR